MLGVCITCKRFHAYSAQRGGHVRCAPDVCKNLVLPVLRTKEVKQFLGSGVVKLVSFWMFCSLTKGGYPEIFADCVSVS